MAEADREKLKRLLDYWVEHNREHRDEFTEWAEKAKTFAGDTVYGQLLKAAQQMDNANEFLLQALKELRGREEEAA